MSVANVGLAAPPQKTVDKKSVPVTTPAPEVAKDPAAAPDEKPAPDPAPVPAPEPVPAPVEKPAVVTAPVATVAPETVVAATVKSTEPVRTAEVPTVVKATVLASALVTPVLVSGNPALGAGGFRIDESDLPAAGTGSKEFTFVLGDITIHLSVAVVMTEEGMEFSFTSDYPVLKVYAKGGPNAYLYSYPLGVLSDSGLHAPMVPSGFWADLSHIDFYFVEPGAIEVIKYNDLDRDGEFDQGEPLLPGWTFTIRDEAGDVVASAATGAEGSVPFSGLLPGDYTVEETLQDDWVVTTDPYPVPVTLTSGGEETVYVGNAEVADIEVLKFEDVNGNGERDTLEPLLDGWTIRLLDGDTVIDTAVTVDGHVVFSDVAPGAYSIDEIQQSGWEATTEVPLAITVIGGQDASYEVGNRHSDVTKTFELTYADAPEGATFFAAYTLLGQTEARVELVAGEGDLFSGDVVLPYGSIITGVRWIAVVDDIEYVLGEETDLREVLTADLTNEFEYTATVSGFKFGDADENGVWDEAELGLEGWTIGLYRALPDQGGPTAAALPLPLPGFELIAQTVTDADGAYSFTGLLPGTYYVAEEVRDGWTMTVAPEGTFEVADGTALTDLDFGNFEPGVPFTDFTFDKSTNVTTASPGAIVTYTLTYSLSATSAPWTDPIPVIDDYDQTYMTPVDVGTGVVADGKITWTDNADMAAGESRTITYTMRVDSEMPEGTTLIDNIALLDVLDGFEDDAEISVTVEPVLPFTEFTFDKSANMTTASPGAIVTYKLTYTLTADSDRWIDPIPVIDDYDERYMTPVNVGTGVVANGKITWTDNADMAPGESRTITYTMRVDATMPVGTTVIDNVALLDVQQGYTDDWTVTVKVAGEPFLPFTGSELLLLVLAAVIATASGLLLRRVARANAS